MLCWTFNVITFLFSLSLIKVILNCFEMILLFNVWVWISSITTPKLSCKALELFSLSRFLIVICVELKVDKSMLSFTWIVLVELLLSC
ncbi:hypothetical protein NW731_01800 [Mycoplasmopsis felis]|uniref:hypothetical protein n=1 Tax=Mycoplasmopsis felis TaxID=33923 RepID=UPI0021DF7D69|nr:hypothetical protein [Mycoplasmopsis felis]MCU9937243.1 hypothetical protein [Mycoplasmopsis felis]